MTLTKNEIAEKLNMELGYTKSRSCELIEAVIEQIKKILESSGDVLVSGFGKFYVQAKQERKGRNPATGAKLVLRPRKRVNFKCSRKLRERINGKVGISDRLPMWEYKDRYPVTEGHHIIVPKRLTPDGYSKNEKERLDADDLSWIIKNKSAKIG